MRAEEDSGGMAEKSGKGVAVPNVEQSGNAAPTDGVFRILAVDGGGFRGVYPAHLLSRIEAEWGVDWPQHFSLIAGTSTGSIIAAGLAAKIRAADLLDLYKKHGHSIFRGRPFCRLGLLGSRYRNTALKAALAELFGEAKLGELPTPLIIPATDIANGCVHVLKSAYDPGFVRDRNILVRDAVLASCSAPTYFDPCRLDQYILSDGGLWANSPGLVAAIDAKRRLGVSLDRLRVLSLGTGTSKQFYPMKHARFTSLFGWGFATRWKGGRFVNMLLNLQAETACNMLKLLLDEGQILRLTFESDRVLPLDDVRDLDDLVSRADRDFTHNAAAIAQFLNLEGGER